MESERGSTAWSWREQRRYLREIRPYLFASVLLIGAGTVFGFATSTYDPELSSARREALRDFVKLFIGLPKPFLALAIFLNNTLKTLLVIVLGVVGGILPLVFLLVNGYVLGIVFQATVQSKGFLTFILAIAPHGLFELPAILLGASIGLMLGARSIKRFFTKDDKPVKGELARSLRFFLLVIVPLLLFAALIEAFITSAVAGK